MEISSAIGLEKILHFYLLVLSDLMNRGAIIFNTYHEALPLGMGKFGIYSTSV